MDPTDFCVVHVNIRGLRANLVNLIHYIEKVKFPDIITLNETKLNINQHISIPNYEIIARKERRGCQHGSLILKRNDVQDTVVLSEMSQFHEEAIGIRINGNSARPTVNVITYYNPPNSFINSAILRTARNLRGKTIITGDLNCKHVSWGSTKNDGYGRDLLKTINDNQLFILNDGTKTRYDPHNGNEQALDLTITNSSTLSNFVSWCVDNDIGSDHYPIRTCFSLGVARQQEYYRSLKNTNWAEFQLYLSTAQLPVPRTAEELDEAVDLVTKKIIESFERACPLRKKRYQTTVPFTKEMIALVKEKRRLRRLKAEARRSLDLASVALLQKLINMINKELKKKQAIQKRERVRNLCDELNKEKNSSRFFGLFDEIRGQKTKTNAHCNVADNGFIATTDKEKATLFAQRLECLHQTRNDDAFNDNWKSTVESFVNENKNAFQTDMKSEYTEAETGDENPLLSPITKEEIIEQLRKCKDKSAPGDDGLHYAILKKLPGNVILYLQSLFNVSISLGYFPAKWKSATIKMVPKPGKDHKEAKNWRPISLLSCLGKLFERIFTSRLTAYLEEKKLISPFQSGFRKGRMTSEQLFRLSEGAHTSLKKKGITAALFLDAEAAFDQAWHDAIRYKLHKLGLPIRIVRLVSSFLTGRKLKVKMGTEISEEVEMLAGTPQGSCLSPLLYIILVNDIPSVSQSAAIGQFADDIGLWASTFTFNAAISRLQQAVNTLEGWCRNWRIKLNGSKSNLLLFHRLQEKPSDDPCIQLFNDIVRPCHSAKYLGVQFDEKLYFKEHFHDLESRATSRLNLFKLLAKNGVENRTLVRLYKVYVRPLFEYGSISFLPADITRLQRIQNEFLRVSLRLPRYLRNDLVHKSAGLSVLKDRLIELNSRLLRKMSVHEVMKESIKNSSNIIALNRYSSPLDFLKGNIPDLL